MARQKDGFKIKANSELKLEQGHKHIMLFGINKELFSEGKNIDLILKFIKKDKSIIEIIQNFDIKTKNFKCKKCCAE
jgi:copper(I)-binding protein